MVDWHQMPHEGIRTLTPYQPGKSESDLLRERGIQQAIKLASNENPLGCSHQVLSVLAGLSAKQVATYPGPYHHPLKAKVAEYWDIDPQQVVFSNGSDALFAHIFTLFCLHKQKSILTHQHCFPSYPIQAKTLGIPIEFISLNESWQWQVDDFVQACQSDTGVLIFANPNNPTGVKVSQKTISALLEDIPQDVIVVIDEAYYEYAFEHPSESALPLINRHQNVIITHSFSKAYGLANCRLGYAIAHPDLIELVWRIQQPFAVNGLALLCGEAALQDQAFVQQSLEVNRQGMQQLAIGFERLGYEFIPSHTNFITVKAGQDAHALNDYLLNQGIIVRPLAASGMAEYLRISIGTETQNKRLLDVLGSVDMPTYKR